MARASSGGILSRRARSASSAPRKTGRRSAWGRSTASTNGFRYRNHSIGSPIPTKESDVLRVRAMVAWRKMRRRPLVVQSAKIETFAMARAVAVRPTGSFFRRRYDEREESYGIAHRRTDLRDILGRRVR